MTTKTARTLPACCQRHDGPHLHGCIRSANHPGACILPARDERAATMAQPGGVR